MDVFVARQPIFKRSGHVEAYELLFRSSELRNHQIGAEQSISTALLGTARFDNPYSDIYELVCRYEKGEWEIVRQLAGKLGIDITAIGKAYSESTLWAHQALHSTTRKADARQSVRHKADGRLHILWHVGAGQDKTINAKLINVSTGRLQLQVPESIPLHTAVSCNEPKMGISGTGRVRYCHVLNGQYPISLDFSNGTGWREPS